MSNLNVTPIELLICLTDDYTDFLEYGYEIYELQDDNSFELIYDYFMWEK